MAYRGYVVGSPLRPRRLPLPAVLIAVLVLVGTLSSASAETEGATTTVPSDSEAQTTETTAAGSSTTLSAEQSRDKARAVANLNLAKAADVEIAESLRAINEEANATLEKIEAANERIEAAEAAVDRSMADLERSDSEQQQIEQSLTVKAVEGFKSRSIGDPYGILGEASVRDSLRQNQLLDEVSSSTTELLEELRGLLEDRRYAAAMAEQAATDANNAEQELQAQLENLKEQQETQVDLKREVERRIDQWAGELTAYAAEDSAIRDLIGSRATVVNTAINNPTTPSALGFQWPLDTQPTSEYGYRTHPILKQRKLHAGIDQPAPVGTPIASSNEGVVIFAGSRRGYGQTVIVDHGGEITSLYAHMNEIGVVEGQNVARGDILGFVGKTGLATGYHLHFEIRVGGGAVNPRLYLP